MTPLAQTTVHFHVVNHDISSRTLLLCLIPAALLVLLVRTRRNLPPPLPRQPPTR